MPSLGELIAPRRLGTDFRWLMASSWTSNIGDGIALSAAPLLIASLTSSPLLVAGGAMMQFLPWLLFGLLAGSVADHHDRRRLVMLANGSRAVIVLALVDLPRDRPGHRVGRARDVLPLRHRRGVRRHGGQHAPADARAAGRPGARQRAAAGRVPRRQPARRSSAGRVPLRDRVVLAVPRPDPVREPRRDPHLADRAHAGPAEGRRSGGHEGASDPRGSALAARQRPRADARASSSSSST